ncbi:MAG: LysR family transcriptional regulator [Pseudolabrys sp.]
MTNIPTDLLRTLVAVYDLKSFTRAARLLGVTQPAVSAQIKRLQFLVGVDIFDRTNPGVSLTKYGEEVVSHARRMLAINDQILMAARAPVQAKQIRVGLPGDLSGPMLPWAFAKFRKRRPGYSYHSRSGSKSKMFDELRRGDLDILVTLSWEEPTDARHYWKDQLVWVRSGATRIEPEGSVPLVAFSEECMCYRTATEVLRKIGRDSQLVMTASTMLSLSSAVDAGLGTLVMTRGRVRMTQMQCWNDAPLPALPEIYSGIYVREGDDIEPLNELADELAPILRPQPEKANADPGEFKSLRVAFDKAEILGKQARSN